MNYTDSVPLALEKKREDFDFLGLRKRQNQTIHYR